MKKNNQLIHVLINIVVPLIILTRLSNEEYLGPVWGLVIALSFPLIFGVYEFVVQKQKSLIAVIGFVGILLTGIIGLLKFPPHWIAVKEAIIPLAIGLIVLFSTHKSWQLLTKFLYHRDIFDVDKIQERIELGGLQMQLNKKLKRANIFLSCSFFFSAMLNYLLAKIIVQSMPGTTQFNEEIGRMTMLSFPVIVLPSVVIMIFIFRYMIASIKGMTQLSTEDILSGKLTSNSQG